MIYKVVRSNASVKVLSILTPSPTEEIRIIKRKQRSREGFSSVF